MPLRLTLLLMLLSTIVFSQTNNQQYDLNDPRNPDCPCHKLQKQAEDEYKQQQVENNTDNQMALNNNKVNFINQDNNVNDNNGIEQQSNERNNNFGAGSQNLSSGKSDSGGIQKKKDLIWLVQKKRNIYKIKHSKIKKFRIKTSDCFHWD
jgi:hypothetical protein